MNLPPLTGNVILKAGVYDVTSRTTVPGNCTIVSTEGAVIRGKLPSGDLLWVRGDNVVFDGVTFDGGGVFRDEKRKNLTFQNVTFKNTGFGERKAAITGNNCFGLTVKRCLFDACSWVTWLGDEQDILFENNDIVHCGYGMKVFGNSTTNKNWVARYNYTRDCGPDFMAYEWQGFCTDFLLELNLTERIVLGPSMVDNDHSLVHSLPMAMSDRNGKVRFNVFYGAKPSGNIFHPMAFEVGGGMKGNPNAESLYESNYIDGCNVAFAATDKNDSCRVRLKNNFVQNANRLWNNDGPNQEVILEGANGTDAPAPMGFASWDLFIAELRKRVGRTGGITPTPIPPVVIPPTQPSIITGTWEFNKDTNKLTVKP